MLQLRPLPPPFQQTRDALHQVAFFVLGPLRYQAEGRMGLKAAPGGFGTPKFDGRVARVDGESLVYEQQDEIASQIISSIRAATEFYGIEYDPDWYDDFHDPLPPGDPDITLEVEDAAARALGQWFNFGFEVLESLRAVGEPEDDASEVQLWPEHFDPATELGDANEARRASYGASPGDSAHPEPYFYVAPWSDIDRSSPFWNDTSFNGASLSYSSLLSADDPNAAALEFLQEGYRILHS